MLTGQKPPEWRQTVNEGAASDRGPFFIPGQDQSSLILRTGVTGTCLPVRVFLW